MRAFETSFFRTHPSRILCDQEAENELKVTCDKLKYRCFDFTQVAFWGVQGEENEFPVNSDHFKHRFLDITKVEFWACQEEENDF